MSLKIGIVGLPNVGKSTLFNALSRKKVDISNYPFCTIEPNVGVVPVPDERLQKLSELAPQAEVIPAVIEIVDVAGLVKGAAEGEGLGNQFLSHLFPMDALMFLIRCFRDPEITSVVDDPEEQLAILKEELYQKDEEITARATKQNLPLSRDRGKVVDFSKLSEKPKLVVCNIRGGTDSYSKVPENLRIGIKPLRCDVALDCKLELELSEMSEQEQKELGFSSELPKLIQAAYKALDLITFYTLKGGRELRAWPVKRGTWAPEAGGIIHSDFRERFIRLEVIDCDKLINAGSWTRAKERGWIRVEGKEYMVEDGDVTEFKV